MLVPANVVNNQGHNLKSQVKKSRNCLLQKNIAINNSQNYWVEVMIKNHESIFGLSYPESISIIK